MAAARFEDQLLLGGWHLLQNGVSGCLVGPLSGGVLEVLEDDLRVGLFDGNLSQSGTGQPRTSIAACR